MLGNGTALEQTQVVDPLSYFSFPPVLPCCESERVVFSLYLYGP